MATTTEFPAHPFWDFALPVYQTKGVGDACIALQDRYAIDVNCVLYCCFVGASGRGALDAPSIERLIAVSGPWNREVVQALRAVRRRMRGGVEPVDKALSDSLRQRLLAVEIDCERCEMVTIGQALDRPARAGVPAEDRAKQAAANIGAYFARLGVKPTAEDCRSVAVIVGAALTEVPEARMGAICGELQAA